MSQRDAKLQKIDDSINKLAEVAREHPEKKEILSELFDIQKSLSKQYRELLKGKKQIMETGGNRDAGQVSDSTEKSHLRVGNRMVTRKSKMGSVTGAHDKKDQEREMIRNMYQKIFNLTEKVIATPNFKTAKETVHEEHFPQKIPALLRMELIKENILNKSYSAYDDKKMEIRMIDGEIEALTAVYVQNNTAIPRDVEIDVEHLEESIQGLQDECAIYESSEIGSTMIRIESLKHMANEVQANKVIELPSQMKMVDASLEHMRRHTKLLFSGHLGGGKTAMARHLAKLFMIENLSEDDYEAIINNSNEIQDVQNQLHATKSDKMREKIQKKLDETIGQILYSTLEPEVFSGSHEASIYDLVGKIKIDLKEGDHKSFDEIRNQFNKLGYEDMPDSEIKDLMKSKVVDDTTKYTTTMFSYGPLGRALKKGVPIIIDEINMMSPAVLSRINDIALRKPGEKFRLQENGEEEFEMKSGFAIVGTMNLGKQYAGTLDLNAATRSRFVAYDVDYPTLDENYDLILASLVDKNDATLPRYFPKESFHKLARLAVVTSEIQDLFTGKYTTRSFFKGGTGAKTVLENTVLSTRDLVSKIMLAWKAMRFKNAVGTGDNVDSLDMVILRNFIASQSHVKDEQKLILELFMRHGFFRGWKSEQFAEFGIRINQDEIDTLTAFTETEDYKTEESKYIDLINKASERSTGLERTLFRDLN